PEGARNVAEAIGIGQDAESPEDKEQVERMMANLEVIENKDSTPEQIVDAAKNLQAGRKDLRDMLEAAGHDTAKIEQVMGRDDLPEEPVPNEETEEEEQEIEEARKEGGAVDDIKNTLSEAKGLMAKGDDATEEELDEFREKVHGKLHQWLYNGYNGLLRPEKRFKRLAVKPTVSVLLAMLVLYMSCLHIATNWATKRVGGGK
ncbi:MAG: hypothetical protein ACREGC_03280, partial [Minisyncoccia bacterium]